MHFRLLAALTVAALFAPANAFSQPPQDAGRGRGASAAQRALQNRREALSRRVENRPSVAGRGSSTRPSAAARGLENRPSSPVGRGIENRPNPVPGRGIDVLPVPPGLSRSAGRRPERVGPQFGTGRVGQESRSRRAFGLSRRPELRPQDRPARPDRSETGRPAVGRARAGIERGPQRNRFGVTQADRLLAKRLATIDKLRDIAVENGNDRLLERADELERIARQQYARRTFEGEPRDRNEALPLRPEPLPDPPVSEPEPANVGTNTSGAQ